MSEPTIALQVTDEGGGWIQRASAVQTDSSLNPVGYGGVMQLAAMLQKSAMLPKSLRGDMAGTALVLTQSLQMQIPWTVGLKELYVVDSKVQPSARLLRALVERHPDCLLFDISEATNDKATVRVHKRGWDQPREITYTMADAKLAGLPGRNPNYGVRPREMMVARVSGLAANMYFPSVCLGLDVTEDPVEATVISHAPVAPSASRSVVARIIEEATPKAPEPVAAPQEAEFDREEAYPTPQTVEPEAAPQAAPEVDDEDAAMLREYASGKLGLFSDTFLSSWVAPRHSGLTDLTLLTAAEYTQLRDAIDAEAVKQDGLKKFDPEAEGSAVKYYDWRERPIPLDLKRVEEGEGRETGWPYYLILLLGGALWVAWSLLL